MTTRELHIGSRRARIGIAVTAVALVGAAAGVAAMMNGSGAPAARDASAGAAVAAATPARGRPSESADTVLVVQLVIGGTFYPQEPRPLSSGNADDQATIRKLWKWLATAEPVDAEINDGGAGPPFITVNIAFADGQSMSFGGAWACTTTGNATRCDPLPGEIDVWSSFGKSPMRLHSWELWNWLDDGWHSDLVMVSYEEAGDAWSALVPTPTPAPRAVRAAGW